MTDKDLLHAKLQTEIKMPIGDVLSGAFDLFGKAAGKYIGFMVLMFFAVIILGVITAVSLYLGMLVIILFVLFVLPGLQVGIGRFTKNLKEDRNPQFSDFFSGFQHNLSQLVLQSFVISVISLAIAFGLNHDLYLAYYDLGMNYDGDLRELANQMFEINEQFNQTTILSFFGALFSFYISLGLSLTPYIVSFYKVSAFTGMDISFRTINKVVFNAVAIQFVLGFIAFMGFIVLLVGLFATLPIAFIGSYLMFRYAIGEKDSIEPDEFEINEHLL